MSRFPSFYRLASAIMLTALPLHAADFSDPTWPCVQRKVENLSPGLMWPSPIEPDTAPTDEAVRADVAELSAVLALRRIKIEELEEDVAAFTTKHGGDEVILGHVFVGTFEILSKRRSRIIGGIADFSLGQIALSESIDTNRSEMDAILATAEPDFDRVDALEEQIDWDQVIYTDRQRNIQYLCETPVLLERRLFSIAQMLQFAVD